MLTALPQLTGLLRNISYKREGTGSLRQGLTYSTDEAMVTYRTASTFVKHYTELHVL